MNSGSSRSCSGGSPNAPGDLPEAPGSLPEVPERVPEAFWRLPEAFRGLPRASRRPSGDSRRPSGGSPEVPGRILEPPQKLPEPAPSEARRPGVPGSTLCIGAASAADEGERVAADGGGMMVRCPAPRRRPLRTGLGPPRSTVASLSCSRGLRVPHDIQRPLFKPSTGMRPQ